MAFIRDPIPVVPPCHVAPAATVGSARIMRIMFTHARAPELLLSASGMQAQCPSPLVLHPLEQSLRSTPHITIGILGTPCLQLVGQPSQRLAWPPMATAHKQNLEIKGCSAPEVLTQNCNRPNPEVLAGGCRHSALQDTTACHIHS